LWRNGFPPGRSRGAFIGSRVALVGILFSQNIASGAFEGALWSEIGNRVIISVCDGTFNRLLADPPERRLKIERTVPRRVTVRMVIAARLAAGRRC
jgi:hypothetical protein